MSHFAVMVIGENPEKQLAPYDENIEVPQYCAEEVSEEQINRLRDYYSDDTSGYASFEIYAWEEEKYMRGEDGVWRRYSTYNPKSKWDWYQLGGRFSGAFIKLKPNATGIMGEANWPNDYKNGVDAAYKKDIDFKAIRDEAADKARKLYRRVVSFFNGNIPEIISWGIVLNDKEYEALSIKGKREFYHNQKGVSEWHKSKEFWHYDLESFQCTEEEYVKQAVSHAFVPFALVKDGEWYERGRMGWWAIVTDEMDADVWVEKVSKMIEELPDDTLISIYDCHI